MQDISERLTEIFSVTRLLDKFLTQLLPDLLVATLTFLAIYAFWRLLSRAIAIVSRRAKLDDTAQGFVQAVVKYSILTIAVVTALGQVGIDTGSLIASLGIAGLTIGFAAKDALANIISGVFIFWDRPFVIGDLIEVGEHYGRVETITMRSTRVVTTDGRMLAIPNAMVLNTTVASYTNFAHLRIEIDVTVGVNEDLGRAREVLLALVTDDERYMKDPKPVVVVTQLNDYNVALQLRAWLDDERDHVARRTELRERVFEALRGASIDMPYETIALTPLEVHSENRAQAA